MSWTPAEDRAGESKPWICDFERLERCGARLPEPEALGDEEATTKLWEVIGRLAGLGIFLDHTDHLSDRELYSRLWHEVLREETPDSFDDAFVGAWVIDMVGQGSEDELRLWLRHYATEAERAEWARDFPEDCIGPHSDPPYQRDRFLPAPVYH